MRRMVSEAEARAAAAHKKSLDSANEAKRLAPLEGKVARLEEQLAGSKADVDRWGLGGWCRTPGGRAKRSG